MADELSAWGNQPLPPAEPKAARENVRRLNPIEQRTLNNAEILAGSRGEKKNHAVRFKDLNYALEETVKGFDFSTIPAIMNIGDRLAATFALIDAESRQVVSKFNSAFDDAAAGLNALTTQYVVLESQAGGFVTSIETLTTTTEGIDAVYGVRVNNNGHISGFGLISELREGVPVSDFLIADANFRIVKTTGGGNYTPFAVYTSSRTVNGATVPPGVYAQDLYVTRAQIANLAVDTLQIAGNAVTVPNYGQGATLTGNNTWQEGPEVSITLNISGSVLIAWSCQQGYSGTTPQWSWDLHHKTTGAYGSIDSRTVPMQEVADQPSGIFRHTGSAGVNTYKLRWKGDPAAGSITCKPRMWVVAAMK